MAQFDFYLNRQGVRGPQGIQGEQGFSPIITVATNTLSEYVLQIQTQNNTFLTANLREHKDDLGGTYIRYNRETGVMYAGDADVASQSQMGVVRFATATDIERETEDCVVSPANVADMIEAIDPSGDISDLQSRVTTLEGKTESLEGSVSANSLAISELQSSVSGLLANYVPKTRTINGYTLSSNITLTASDVNAYSKSEADTLLATKADISDLPDMNNYYNTTQIDLMLNEKADISDIPTVGNGVITINQGGVQRGQFSLNQTGNATINLTDGGGGGGGSYIEGNGIDITNDIISAVPDGTTIDFNTNGELKVISAPTPSNMVTTDTTQIISGLKEFSGGLSTSDMRVGSNLTIRRSEGQYVNLYTNLDSGNIGSYALTSLPIATTSALGGVIPDGTTITVDADGTIHGASTYVLPTASTSTLGGVKVDGTTVTINSNGVISASGGSTPSNMVTTDTAQTITGAKTFNQSIKFSNYNGIATPSGANIISRDSSDGIEVGNENEDIYICGDIMYLQADGLYRTNADGSSSRQILDAYNISTYLPTASTSTKGCVKVDGTTITINSSGVISSAGGGGSSYTAGIGIDIDNDVISIDDTVVASKDDLDSKQDNLNPVAPINIQSITTGSVYVSSTGNEFTGTTITENLSLFSTTMTNSFDINADFSFERKNVTITAIPSAYKNIISVGAGVTYGMYTLGVYFNNSGVLGSDSNIGSYRSATANISTGTYDFKICRESGVYKTQYKLSSSDTYIDLLNFSGSVSSSYYNKDVKIGATEGVVSDITDVKFISQGTTLFERAYNQLSLSIGTGLSIVNGALTATATPVTVDQTYNASSTNAQSGTAVAEAVADKVNSSDLVNVHVVTETYVNGASWYRVYSDGWCEQGGRYTNSSPGTVTFLKPYANSNISVVGQCIESVNGPIYGDEFPHTYTSTGFSYSESSNRTFTWQASGYIS